MADQALDELAGELYTVHPAGFVAARNAVVQRAREAGDRAAAWAVNLLVRSAPADVAQLLSLGEQLRSAQQRLQGEQMRRLNEQRREVVAALVRRARRLAADAGHPLSAAATVEVEQTLTAALADPDEGQAVRAGQLTHPLQYVGLGAEPLVAAPPDARPPAGQVPAPGPGSEPSPEDEITGLRRRRVERAAQGLARASDELQQASARAERAEEQLRDAGQRVAELDRRIAELQQQREQAQREEADAQRKACSAARVRDEAQRRVLRLTEDQRAAR
ncbi:MAG TPA: hypothetical protein VHH34_15755 [Pseudonocardiaceae bacterium]|nr:hypothetical protein [Pseudonocardiaceae bacterium]